ncbi:hypothetical protein HY968_04060 [Candidatus Kaiserbacteria bacterium]|nr:hypothetical protein [Candidatus Kaiserbacteria bacterium]
MAERIWHPPSFGKPLERSPFDKGIPLRTNIFQFQDDPRFTVREFKYDYDQFAGIRTGKNFPKKIKGFFDELRDTYSINVPVHFVVANNPKGRKCIYVITDVVKPQNLSTLSVDEKQKFQKQYGKLLNGLLKYLIHKFEKKERFLEEIMPVLHDKDIWQYVYGKKEGDTDDRIYLVDTDLFIARPGKWALEDAAAQLNGSIQQAKDDYNIVGLEPLLKECLALQSRIEGTMTKKK